MLTMLNGVTFNRSGKPPLPNILPYPQQLGSMVKAWFEADQGDVETGNLVTSLTDMSASGIVLTKSGNVNYLPASQNGLPSIQSSATTNAGGNMLTAPSVTGQTIQSPMDFDYNTPFSVSVAMKRGAFTAGITSWQTLLGMCGGSSAAQGWQLNTGDTNSVSGGDILELRLSNGSNAFAAGVTGAANGLVTGSTFTLTITYDGSGSSANMTVYVNGAPVTATKAGTSITSSILTTGARAFSLLGSLSHNAPDILNGALVCNAALTPTQAAGVDSYFNKKWALHS